jgi:alkanesulfonate monooxygenase SsuD/methylene tetrahydromethanopterin reductase-like flavin-dependent oxidoreductase (luciferase family)
LIRGTPGRLPPPIVDIESYWTPAEKAHVTGMLSCSFVGTRERVRGELKAFIDRTGVEELVVASAMYDHAARVRSYEILIDAMEA